MWKINKKLLISYTVAIILVSAVGVVAAHNRFINKEEKSDSVEEVLARNRYEDREEDNDSVKSESIVKYDNPIDEYYIPIFESDRCFAEIRGAELCYYYVWETEYENIIKWLKVKCHDSADLEKVMKLDENIQDCIDEFGEIVELEMLGRFEKDERRSGNGTTASVRRIKGELYREYSIHIIESYGGEDPYVYMDRNYSEIMIP